MRGERRDRRARNHRRPPAAQHARHLRQRAADRHHAAAPPTRCCSAPRRTPIPEDESLPVLHDYSDDYYLEPTPDTDKGVQIRRDDTSGCHYDPTGTTHPESQVHRWVTDPMPHDFEMGGKVTLEFYTRTLNDALYTGTLCVFLFEREESAGSESPGDRKTTRRLINKDGRHAATGPTNRRETATGRETHGPRCG